MDTRISAIIMTVTFLTALLSPAAARAADDRAAAAPPRIEGVPRILDGRTLKIGRRIVVLAGIDAPPRGQVCAAPDTGDYRCGDVATRVLDEIVAARQVECEPVGTLPDGETSAVCSIDGHDIGREMVRFGWGVAKWLARTPEKAPLPCDEEAQAGSPCAASVPDYLDAEAEAVAGRRGLWGGRFDLPWAARLSALEKPPH